MVLTSLKSGVAVVDREFRVTAWNRHAENVWELRADEVKGQHLLNLDIGLSVQSLRPALKASLNGEESVEQLALEVVNRRGRKIRCQVTSYPLADIPMAIPRGVIILMDEMHDGTAAGRAHAPS